jgi:hypothetical protein
MTNRASRRIVTGMPEDDRNYLALFNGARGWDRKADTYGRSDDGVHITGNEGDWEWWYFDFSFENGWQAVATLHYRNMMLRPHIPTMQLFIYPPEGPPMVKAWAVKPGQICAASKDRCDVNMGGLSARDQGDHYRLSMDMKDVGIDVTIKNVVPSWKAGTGVLWRNPEMGLETGWIVPVPRGEVTGVLKCKGRNMEVRGAAHHDHNYGNCAMETVFKGWFWGRLLASGYTLVYGWVIPRESGRPMVSPLMLAKDDTIVLSTDMMSLTVEESKVDETYGFEMPMRIRIVCEGDGVKLDCVLGAERVVETLALPRGDSFYHYYRFLSEFEARIAIDGKEDTVSGRTLHEAMFLD